jgi:hypothetical protein
MYSNRVEIATMGIAALREARNLQILCPGVSHARRQESSHFWSARNLPILRRNLFSERGVIGEMDHPIQEKEGFYA